MNEQRYEEGRGAASETLHAAASSLVKALIDYRPTPDPEIYPLEPRPLAEGLRAIAHQPSPPGDAYHQFMRWGKRRGYAGYASTYEDTRHLPSNQRLLAMWLPQWRQGLYVSTSITSGGAVFEPGLSMGEAIAQNTILAQDLTDQIIADHGFDSRDVLLSTDLPKVPGWKQSDYLIFWLMCLEGVPTDICQEMGRTLQAGVLPTMDARDAPADQKWPAYEQLVTDFYELCKAYLVYSRNDYAGQTAGIRQMVQLVDTDRSLGCRAEELYAHMRGIALLSFELNPNALQPGLRDQVTRLTSLGATIGRQPVLAATRLVPAD